MITERRILRADKIGRAAILSVSVLLLACPTAANAGEKYALLIGTNSYQSVARIPELKYPEKDVDELKAALERQGFRVTALKGYMASRESIIRELARIASLAKRDDTFLLAFSGHGVRNEPVNKEPYWLTYTAQLDALDVQGIRLKHLLDYVYDIPASKKLVLLDHCFSGNITLVEGAPAGGNLDAGSAPAGGTPRGGAGSVTLEMRGQSLDVTIPAENTERSAGLVVLAASYGLAYESPTWEHGVFTKAVLEAIDEFRADQGAPVGHGDGNGQVSVMELIAYVEQRVPDLAREKNISQVVVPKQLGASGLAEWMIAERRRGLKREDFTDWYDRGWITPDAYTYCVDLVASAEESERTRVALEPGQERKLQQIRDVIANPNQAERAKARAVSELCKR